MAKRIGLLTLPLHINYGGIIQAAALSQFLRALGHQVTLIDRRGPASRPERLALALLAVLPFQNVKGIRRQKQEAAVHRPFVRDWIGPVTPALRSTPEMAAALDRLRLDAVVVGSDQVWRLDYLPKGAVTDFFLGLPLQRPVRKIAYAASFGVRDWTHPDQTAAIRPHLAAFDAVSVREASGVALCRDVLGRAQCDHVLDPTLMVDPALYARMMAPPASPASVIPASASPASATPAERAPGPVLLRYTLDGSPEREAIAQAAVRTLGPDWRASALTLESSKAALGLPDWLRAFRDADFIVTDSFHGVAFSIIFQKDFIAIPNHGRGVERFTSLLGALGLTERLIRIEDVDAARDLARQPVDYARVNARLDRLRAESRAFLEAALR